MSLQERSKRFVARPPRRTFLKSACLTATFSAIGVVSGTQLSAAEAFFEDIHAIKLPKRKYGYRGIVGDLVAINDGRLLLSYAAHSASGASLGAVAGRFSADQGRTWGDEFTLIAKPQPDGPHGYYHPSFLRLDDGQILLTYFYYVDGTRPTYKATYYRRSTDEAQSWTDQLLVGLDAAHNDKPVQISSGRLIVPVEKEVEVAGGDHRGYVSRVYYSDDRGLSWRASPSEVNMLPVEAQEPHVVELKDGRLLMLVRTYSGYVGRAYSIDQGRTWTKGEAVRELSLPPNSSALCVKRIPATGDLLLLRCSGGTGGLRTPFVSAISTDEGRTWTGERVIMGDPKDDYGYPSLTFVGRTAIISYHQRDGLHVARIGLDWFYGK